MRFSGIVSCFLIVAGTLQAQSYLVRANFGARLEPRGGLMHGAGQSSDAFAAYSGLFPAGRQPMVFMYYVNLQDATANWSDGLKAELRANYPNSFIIPQIGLGMTNGVSASGVLQNYEAQVAAGAYDRQIADFVTGLQRLALPAYVRIGYEFNGTTYAGYQPAPYQQAFIRVTNAIRAANVEVATVWDAAVGNGVTNYFDYYPGDQYVDWFGLNIFEASAFSDPSLSGFFAQARARKKPIMLGEESPAGVGAQGGAASWNGWYTYFFNFLQSNPEVKQFNYIDSNWADTPGLTTWGDARLETDAATYVRNLYVAQLADPIVLNASSETAFRKLLYNDSTAPPTVSDLRAASGPTGITLTWTPVQDPSGIARYYIYRDGALLSFWLGPGFLDSTATPGTAYSYTVAAMDRAGNLSAPSNAVVVAAANPMEMLLNGGFESGMGSWTLMSYDQGAAGTAVVDSTNPLDGSASLRLTVSKSSGTAWHLQLYQSFQMTQGLTYQVRFTARASAPLNLPFMVQQVASPHTGYLTPTAAVGVNPTHFEYSFVAPVSGLANASFCLGNIIPAILWLDDVSVQESNPVGASAITKVNTSWGGTDIAQNTFIEVKGTDLVPATTPAAGVIWSNAPDFASGKMPTSLNGVSVTVNGKPAFVYFYCSTVTSPVCATDQIDVLTPLDSTIGPVPVVVSSGNTASTTFTANMKAAVPTFLLFNASGPVVATHADYSLVGAATLYPGATTPAKAGETVIVYAIGFGLPVNSLTNGSSSQSGSLPSVPVCQVGGSSANAIATLISPGLYQLNIAIPPSAQSGDNPVTCAYGSAATQSGAFITVQH
jgi:uncharacterized protein (TIGR03437 family)